MSTFTKIVRETDQFEYRIGTVTTNQPWVFPNAENLKQFLSEVKNLNNYEKYELFLVGGALNNLGKTPDVDILITGNLEIFELEKFLHDLHHLGLNKHRLLIDAKWINDKPAQNLNPKIYIAVQFGKVFKRINNHFSCINLFEKNTKLTEHLVLRNIKYPIKTTNPNFVKI